jgi:hypothetical protein
MEERKYAYMIKFGEYGQIGIMYHLGRYCVARFMRRGNSIMTYTIRQFKTVSGAERFLLRDYSSMNKNAPELLYGTKKFIDEGSYWKEEN